MTSSNGNIFRVTGLCAGNSLETSEFPAQRPVTRSFDVFFDLRWTNSWVNTCDVDDKRRHRTLCDVTVMYCSKVFTKRGIHWSVTLKGDVWNVFVGLNFDLHPTLVIVTCSIHCVIIYDIIKRFHCIYIPDRSWLLFCLLKHYEVEEEYVKNLSTFSFVLFHDKIEDEWATSGEY